jgi:hypothetical protein
MFYTIQEVRSLVKKIFIAVLVLALAVISVLGIKKYAPRFGAPAGDVAPKEETTATSGIEKAEVFSPKYAIPSASPNGGMVVAEIADTRSLRKIVPYALLFLETASGDVTQADSRLNREDIAKGLSFLDKTEDFLDAAEGVAFYAASADKFYVSLSVDGDKFDKFAESGDGSLMKREKWDISSDANASAGRDAWILKPSSPEISEEPLYMTRWNAGGRDVVNIASGAEEIGEMTEAAENPEKRLRVARKTEGENFVAVNFPEPVEMMGGLSFAQAETSWSVKDNKLEIRSYSDMYAPVAARLTDRTFVPGAVPLPGDGEVALFASVDPAFCISASFPTEPDPIKKAFDLWGASIPPQFTANIEDVLRNCRISAVIVAKDQSIDTAYLVIEAEARETLDKLYELARLLAGSPVQLDGWDSAFELNLDRQFKTIMARHEGMILVGMGEVASFNKKAGVSAGVVPPPDASRVLALTATSRILEVKAPGTEETLRNMIEKRLASRNVPEALRNIARLDRLERFAFTHSLDGKGEINITFKE